MRVTNQGGSLAGFIIIGVLLTLALVGGLYGLSRYNAEQASTEVAKEDDAKNEEAATNAEPEASKKDQSEATDSGRQTTDTPESSSDSSANSTNPQAAAPTQPQQTRLPETGPADTAFMLLAIGLVTFAGTHYLRSRSQQ